jgi:phosphoribosylglycinamide formyltransferase-1
MLAKSGFVLSNGLQLGVLISGRGSNLQAILDAVERGELDANVRLVLSNKKKALGLERAQKAGVPTKAIGHRSHASREAFDAAMVAALRAAGVEWVVLAGFMRIVTPVFLEAFPGRVVNIHPSLLPSFVGVDAQQQALDHGVRVSGCTVHLVNAGVDAGPILAQAAVPVRDGDDRDSLAARILEREHPLLVQTLQWIAEGRLEAEGSKVRLRGVDPFFGLV